VIRSFADFDTELVFNRQASRRFSLDLQSAAYRKIAVLDAAESLNDLRIPPGNRLEKLKGDREGQYSIRINEQWKICFRWKETDAYDVQIVAYHR